ncbi:Arm DNA-binding domain-containing protein [Streptomyces sp. NPDC051987]|uniref:Arm DNA-binding domain-containing protein n=1 Tax=Streptomyces sp. NPDC051987 TaxID=3155808 RepID=UPI003437AD5C
MSILSDPIKKLPPNLKGKVRYRFVVDAGIDPETGKRKQLRRTFDSLKEARAEYANPAISVSRTLLKSMWKSGGTGRRHMVACVVKVMSRVVV